MKGRRKVQVIQLNPDQYMDFLTFPVQIGQRYDPEIEQVAARVGVDVEVIARQESAEMYPIYGKTSYSREAVEQIINIWEIAATRCGMEFNWGEKIFVEMPHDELVDYVDIFKMLPYIAGEIEVVTPVKKPRRKTIKKESE